MVHVRLDLSRTRLDVHVMDEAGAALAVTTAIPDNGGLAALAARIGGFGAPVYAAIESMNGARFVHDQLELAGWQVEIADAQKVKGLAPLACKTDKIDSWVLAELSRRDLVPAIWLPTPTVRAERERARWRLHLVRHRTALKNRIHATLLAFGHPCPVSDLFGTGGRELLGRLALPEPWAADTTAALSREAGVAGPSLGRHPTSHDGWRSCELATRRSFMWLIALTKRGRLPDRDSPATALDRCAPCRRMCGRRTLSWCPDYRASSRHPASVAPGPAGAAGHRGRPLQERARTAASSHPLLHRPFAGRLRQLAPGLTWR
jgi:hypothetical protein